MEELHHQAVEASVVDVCKERDEVMLWITEPVQDESLPLQRCLVVWALLVELEGHGRAIKYRDPTVDHTATALSHLIYIRFHLSVDFDKVI